MSAPVEAPLDARSAPELLDADPGPDSVSGSDLQSLASISDGPDLPPLAPGLPNTPIVRCQALIAAVIWDAIATRDLQWIASHTFTFYMTLLGVNYDVALRAKRHILDGTLGRPRLYQHMNFLGEDVAA